MGETVHEHNLICESEIEYEFSEKDSLQVDFLLKECGIVTHPEHDKIILQPGEYTKYPQQEYDYWTKANRAVFD